MNKTSSFSIQESQIPTVIIQSNGEIIDFSNTIFNFFEFRKKDSLIGLEDLLGNLSDSFKKGLKDNHQFTETIQVISRKGKTRWLRTNVYPFPETKDMFQISFDDVTLGKTQYELAILANQIGKVGSWTADLINNKLYWSNMTKEIHQVPSNFVPDLEKGINFYKEGGNRELIIDAVSECIESGKSFDLELIIVTAKGNEKWVRAIGEAERNNGKTIGFKGIFQDIDKAKRMSLEHETLNNRLRVGINSANVGVWDFDILNNELFWDNKMYDLYGVKKKDFEGVYDAWARTIHPDDKERAAIEVQNAINNEEELNTEFRIVKKDGSISFIHAEAKVFTDKKGRPYRLIGANTDVTRIKRKDERLRKLLNVTEKQNQRLLQFTNIVSHNLRSNSSNISMLSGMLNSKLSADNQEQFIEMIQTSSEQLDETIVQLNEIVKIQSIDKSEIRAIPVKKMIVKVLESINALVFESDAHIDISIEEELKVNGIKPYLNSVFLNLITNSIKYKDNSRKLKIVIDAKVLTNQTIITFKDNGLGIDLEKHGSKLFGMYKTFHNHKDAKGIGLFITKNHMEAMNGSIEAKSSVNKGSTFYLYFMN